MCDVCVCVTSHWCWLVDWLGKVSNLCKKSDTQHVVVTWGWCIPAARSEGLPKHPQHFCCTQAGKLLQEEVPPPQQNTKHMRRRGGGKCQGQRCCLFVVAAVDCVFACLGVG